MEFVHPEILWGLSALAIPIIIHLLHFRRFRRVAFSQVAFLNEVQKDAKATQRIRHWWVLLMRLLAFAAIIMAFAQPQLPPANGLDSMGVKQNGHAISLYVDNSHSMEAQGEEGQLLQVARNKATLVVEQFNPTDQFQVLTCDFSGKDQKFLTQEQALERIEGIRPSGHAREISEVIARIESQLSNAVDSKRSAYLFSDLQESTHAIADLTESPDTLATWNFVPELAGGAPNIWIDSVWFDEPMRIAGRSAALRMRIQHNSQAAVSSVPMNLTINGERLAIGTFNLVPGLSTDTVMRFTHGTAGLKSGTVSIEDAPIRFDDDWHFGFEVTDRVQITILSERTEDESVQSIERVFQTADGLYAIESHSNWTPELIAQSHLLILTDWRAQGSGFAQEIVDFVEQGGTVAYLPSIDESADESLFSALKLPHTGNWNTTEDRVRSIQLNHPFFRNMFAQFPERIDLPNANKTWNRRPADSEETLAATELGHPFLTRQQIGQGQVFVFHVSANPESSNLTRHALWVPLLLRMAERSYATPINAGEIGSLRRWAIPVDVPEVASLKLVQGTENKRTDASTDETASEWLPEIRQVPGQIEVLLEGLSLSPGHFIVRDLNQSWATIGLNQDRIESNHDAFAPVEYLALIEEKGWSHVNLLNVTTSSLPQIIKQTEQGVPLWKAFIIFSLIALAIETILLRTWKA
jgi:hypothetical protein